MSTVFGLLSSEDFAAQRFTNYRREVLWQFPQGAAPLTGLLSMMGDEVTSDPVFNWFEKRFMKRRIGTWGTDTITQTAPSDADSDSGTAVSGAKTTADDIFVKVDDATIFNSKLIIQINDGAKDVLLVITAIATAAGGEGYLTCRLIRNTTFDSDGGPSAGALVRIVGSAHMEGGSGGYGGVAYIPQQLKNYTQIFRTEFEFTGTAAKTEAKYDDTGPYKEQARDSFIAHMTDIEKSILFGQRSITMVTENGRTKPRRTFSGLIEHMNLWDRGNAGLSIDGETYAPYSDHDPVTSDTDDLKRVIENSTGLMSRKKWMMLLERVGRYHSTRSNDKLVLCGSGAFLTFEEMFQRNSSFNVQAGAEAYGLKFTRYISPFGDFYFKSHPLFNDDPLWRHMALIVDLHSIKWRFMPGRDTSLMKNRQLPNEDLRRDEYLTEAGIEFWFPENNMLIKNLHGYSE